MLCVFLLTTYTVIPCVLNAFHKNDFFYSYFVAVIDGVVLFVYLQM